MRTPASSSHGSSPGAEPHFRSASRQAGDTGVSSARTRPARTSSASSSYGSSTSSDGSYRSSSTGVNASCGSYGSERYSTPAGNGASSGHASDRHAVRLAGSSRGMDTEQESPFAPREYNFRTSAGRETFRNSSTGQQRRRSGAGQGSPRRGGSSGSRRQAARGTSLASAFASSASVVGSRLNRGGYSTSRSSFKFARSGRRVGIGRAAGLSFTRPHHRKLAVCLLVIVFSIATWALKTTPAGMAPTAEITQVETPQLSSAYLPISTPKSQWKKGEMPYLYQSDPMWASQSYGGGTVKKNACGPTSFTMVYIYLTGNTDMTPATMAAWADEHNYAPTGSTEWSFMTEGAASWGLSSEMVQTTRENITGALENGYPVIALMNPGDFTNAGHFIVLSAIDNEGNVTIHDPNNGFNNAHTWPISTICAQSTYSWTFSL